MQPNYTSRNTSSLIRLTEEAKKKARRKLIGSIFMLLIALIILLNVTARIKPIPVNPKVIEIKGNLNHSQASAPSVLANAHPLASQPLKTLASQPALSQDDLDASAPKLAAIASNPSKGFKASIIDATSITQPTTASTVLPMFKPQLVSDTITLKPTPEDILNGVVSQPQVKRYFIQLLATSDKTKLMQIRQTLTKQGIKTMVQSISTENGILYRLRMGPFTTQAAANDRLNDLNDQIKNESNN